MKKKQLRKTTQDSLFEELKEGIKQQDDWSIHTTYDRLLELRLRKHEPSFVRRLKKLVKGVSFWYA